MEEEVKMIEKNNTWELVNCSQGKDIIGLKWVYKTKLNPDRTIQKDTHNNQDSTTMRHLL